MTLDAMQLEQGKPKQNEAELGLSELMARARAHWQAGQAGQAEIWCQRVLARWPGQGDALHLLGLMAHAYGQLDLALAYMRVAVQAPYAPGLYAANLAEMCRQKGLLDEGEQAGRRAVARAPNLPAAWNNLGIILQEAGKFEESRHCLERVLLLQPDNAEACNNLGNTLKRLSLGAEAERFWRRALVLRPAYPQPHSNLCCLLGEQGDYGQALVHGRRAIELEPQLADAYINLAGMESARNNHDAALRWLEALLAFAPQHAVGLAACALVLKRLDRLDEARLVAARAIAAAPNNAEAYQAHGVVLQELGETEAALGAFERAATLPGTAVEQALINRAILFMEHGRREEAQAAFARALAAFPRSASIWFNRADLQKFAADDPAIVHMEALLAAPEAAARNDQMLLHFALGKVYLDGGNSTAAFRHLDAGNALKRAGFDYDPASATRLMAEIAAVFSGDFLTQFAHAGPDSLLPVFIVGMPRSGTTLVEQILSSHSAVHGAGELAHLQKMTGALGNFPGDAAALTAEVLHGLGTEYLARVTPLARGKAHVVDKMPANFVYAGLIRLILPGARIIHCRRDAVDTCLSCYSKLFSGEQLFAYDQAELGLFHNDYEKLMGHWREVLPPAHFLEVNYEELVADVEAQTRRMLAFLQLGWDSACLEFHRTERAVRTASLNQVRQPVYTSSTGRWRHHAAQLQPLLAALGRAT